MLLGARGMMPGTTLSRSLVLAAGVSLTVAAAGCASDEDAPDTGTTARAAGFDWGSDCSSGSGSFSQSIPQHATVSVGEIPARKRNVRVELAAEEDVDVQLIDVQTGTEIIAWPSGILNGPTEECTTYHGVEYCYSGYNGNGTDLGSEWIEVRGDTNRTLEMRAYGYEAGLAPVSYEWEAVDTCNEQGAGSFEQYVPYHGVATVGTIPANKYNVRIELTSSTDVDIQLFDGSVALVKWPDGMLNGPGEQSLAYHGMNIIWSGYNGDGTGLGHEYIQIDGRVAGNLTMKAYGYAAGYTTVDYEWGGGTGALCGSHTLPPCGPGLQCKNGDTGHIEVDVPGSCHTPLWCASEHSAGADCDGNLHIMVPGYWGCSDEHTCVWRTGPALECSMLIDTCADGFRCVWSCPPEGSCGINPHGFCVRECDDSFDCGATQYCTTEGLCRADAACYVPDDCTVEGNEWDSGACIATTTWSATCEDETCGFECLPL